MSTFEPFYGWSRTGHFIGDGLHTQRANPNDLHAVTMPIPEGAPRIGEDGWEFLGDPVEIVGHAVRDGLSLVTLWDGKMCAYLTVTLSHPNLTRRTPDPLEDVVRNWSRHADPYDDAEVAEFVKEIREAINENR